VELIFPEQAELALRALETGRFLVWETSAATHLRPIEVQLEINLLWEPDYRAEAESVGDDTHAADPHGNNKAVNVQ